MTTTQHIQDLALAAFNGKRSSASTYAELYALREALDEAMASVKEAAIEEVRRYGGDGYTHGNLKLTVKSAAGRWSYKGVAAHAELTAKLKAVEGLAQAVAKSAGGQAVTEDGVVVDAATYTAGSDTIYTTKA